MVRLASALALFACLAACVQAPAPVDQMPALADVSDYEPVAPSRLTATTLRTYPAAEAGQGAAVDGRHFYAINNTMIGKYEIATGRLAGRWIGPRNGLIRHLNSCFAEDGRLMCANSNYSQAPHGSSVEIFDTATMQHAGTHSLGLTEEGSLTWFDRYRGGWVAGFAHYTGNGRVPFKDHTYSSVVSFDKNWRRTGGWLFPAPVVDRMAPYAASGGAIGPDGLLYILGHDRPEMYVLAAPAMGPTLIHVATIDLEAEGQAYAWSAGEGRVVYVVNRGTSVVKAIALPEVDLAAFSMARRLSGRPA